MKDVKLYLASPFGFSEAGRLFMYEKIIPLIESAGYQVLDPWVQTPLEDIEAVAIMPYGFDKRQAWQNLNPIIGRNNEAAIDLAQGMVAVLDGVDIDSGTASEIGYATAQQKPVLGYRGDFRLSADNEGADINLQVEYFIKKHGGEIINAIDQLPDALHRVFGQR